MAELTFEPAAERRLSQGYHSYDGSNMTDIVRNAVWLRPPNLSSVVFMNGHKLSSNQATAVVTCPNRLQVMFWVTMLVRRGLLILKDDVVRLNVHVAHPLLMQRSQRTHHLASHSCCI